MSDLEFDRDSDFGVPIPGSVVPESDWAKTGVKRLPEPSRQLDWSEVFGRTAPIMLELGCGNGRYTLQSAIRRPHFDHFASDILPVVIRYATRRGNQRGLSNVRFAVKDAFGFLAQYVATRSVDEVHLYHPQPYHDPKLAHRRLVTPRFLLRVHEVLKPNGLFFIQTDNPDYWSYMQEVIPVFFSFEERETPWHDAPEGRSRREILARSRGLKIFRGTGVRREGLEPEEAMRIAGELPLPRFRSRGPWIDLDRIE